MNEISVHDYVGKKKDTQISILIDVRSPMEYEEGYAEGAVNIPLEDIANHLENIKKYDAVYLICRSGGRSGFAQNLLASEGISNTFNVVGGMISWSTEGLPVVGTFSP